MQTNIDKLNEELNESLEVLEAESAASLERQRLDPEVAAEQEKLRAEYAEHVAPVLKALPAIQKKLTPIMARCEKWLKDQERVLGGVRPEHLEPPAMRLKELRVRLSNIPLQLERTLDRINAGLTLGETLGNWSAQRRTEMRPATSLLNDIIVHHERLVWEISEVKRARRWPAPKKIPIERAARIEAPPEVKTDFRVFEDSHDAN